MPMKHQNLPYADWSWPEFRAAASAFVSAQISRGPDVAELECKLGELLNDGRVFAVNSGRTALQLGLEGLMKLCPQKDEVIIPEFVCPAVVGVVKALGLRPVPVEVGSDLNLRTDAVIESISPRTLVIVVVHMYGCPADIEKLENVARAKGVFLADDAAQVVGESVNGRNLGTFGDFGVLSFAQSKCVVAGESGSGGALICRNGELLAVVEDRMALLLPAEGRAVAFLAFVWNYLLASYTARVSYYWRRVIRLFFAASDRCIGLRTISNLDAKVAICQLVSLPRRREKRIQTLGKYARELLCAGDLFKMPQYAPNRYLARFMVAIPLGIDPEECRVLLRRKSIQTRLGYPTYSKGGCSGGYAEQLGRRLIELPVYSNIADRDVVEVCGALRKAVCASKRQATIRRDFIE